MLRLLRKQSLVLHGLGSKPESVHLINRFKSSCFKSDLGSLVLQIHGVCAHQRQTEIGSENVTLALQGAPPRVVTPRRPAFWAARYPDVGVIRAVGYSGFPFTFNHGKSRGCVSECSPIKRVRTVSVFARGVAHFLSCTQSHAVGWTWSPRSRSSFWGWTDGLFTGQSHSAACWLSTRPWALLLKGATPV